jgi:alkylation response protein AidB-like acyl-CoA dehydrogenase
LSRRGPTRKEKPSRGLSIFIIEKGTPGFEVARKLDTRKNLAAFVDL